METETTQKLATFKKEVLVESVKTAVIHEIDLEEFKTFLIGLLFERGNVKKEISEKLFDAEGIQKIKIAFTHPSMLEPQSFEFFETMGDLTANKCIGWYIYRRFPDLQNNPQAAMYMCEMKKKYISKKLFGPFAEKLGLNKFVRYKEIQYVENVSKEVKKVVLSKSVLEDVFEAFCACLEDLIDNRVVIGTGYSVIYNIISTLMDDEHIVLDIHKLVDPKTQIKEVMDRRLKAYGDKGPFYKHEARITDGAQKWLTSLELELQNHPDRKYSGELPTTVKFVSEERLNRIDGEFETARQALRWFESFGVKWYR